jgi:hypothetical protein
MRSSLAAACRASRCRGCAGRYHHRFRRRRPHASANPWQARARAPRQVASRDLPPQPTFRSEHGGTDGAADVEEKPGRHAIGSDPERNHRSPCENRGPLLRRHDVSPGCSAVVVGARRRRTMLGRRMRQRGPALVTLSRRHASCAEQCRPRSTACERWACARLRGLSHQARRFTSGLASRIGSPFSKATICSKHSPK